MRTAQPVPGRFRVRLTASDAVVESGLPDLAAARHEGEG